MEILARRESGIVTCIVVQVEQLPKVDKSVTQSTALQQLLQLAANAKELALSSTDSSTRS